MRKLFQVILLVFLVYGCSAQGTLVQDAMETVTSEKLNYYLYYPADYEEQPQEDFGLLLFLHGGGESGRDLSELTKNGPPKMMAEGYPFPFLVLAPQNPYEKQWWNVRAVNELLDQIITDNRVDPKRIYLTGLSRGGSAAWEMAVQYPDKFAAMAVVCGMAPSPYAHWLNKKMPIRVFHGAEDAVIPVSESDVMVTKLKEMNHDVTYTRYESLGHAIWGRVYADDELYEWMNQQKLD